MNSCYFSCFYEGDELRLRAIVHTNQYLCLYEVEPEDRLLFEKFGVKFITQPKDATLDLQCSISVQEHQLYERAIVMGLKQHLIAQNF